MGSFLSGPKTPAPPPVLEAPEPPEEAPTPVDDSVRESRDRARRRASSQSGYQGSILTGDIGPAFTGKTILGE